MNALERIQANAQSAAELLADPASIRVPETFGDAYGAYTRKTVPELQGAPIAGGMASGAPPPAQYVQVPAQQPLPGEGGFGTELKMGMIDDPEKRLRMLSDDTGIPLDRMGYVNGEPVYVNDEGNFQRFTSGPGAVGGAVMAHSPEVAGGIAGSILGGMRGRPDAGGALGAMGGLAVKKWLSNLLWDDPIGLGDLGEVALEGTLDIAGAKGLKLAGKLLRRQGVPGIEKVDGAAAMRAKTQIYDATGIDLDLAQLTDIEGLKRIKTWARNYPGEAGDIIKAHDDLVNGQSIEAIERLARAVGESGDPAAAGLRGINAASAAIDMAKAEVDRVVGPLYNDAFSAAREQGLRIDISGQINQIDTMLKYAKGKEARWLKEAKGYLQKNQKELQPKRDKTGKVMSGKDGKPILEEVKVPESTLIGLHRAKRALDEMLARKPGDGALSRDAYFDVTLLKKELVDRLRNESPEYAQAMDVFSQAKKAIVDPLEQSVVGVLAKIPEHNAAQAASKLFTGGRITAKEMRKARNAIKAVESANPNMEGAWGDMVSDWIGYTLNQAMKEGQSTGGQPVNTAGKWLQKAFGTQEQREALRVAVGGDAYGMLVDVTNALRMASRTPTTSSATEFNRILSQQMGEGAVTVLQRILRPRGAALDAMQGQQLDAMAKAVAEALVDPAKASQLRKLRAVTNTQERNIGILGLILSSSALSGGQELVETIEEGMTVE